MSRLQWPPEAAGAGSGSEQGRFWQISGGGGEVDCGAEGGGGGEAEQGEKSGRAGEVRLSEEASSPGSSTRTLGLKSKIGPESWPNFDIYWKILHLDGAVNFFYMDPKTWRWNN